MGVPRSLAFAARATKEPVPTQDGGSAVNSESERLRSELPARAARYGEALAAAGIGVALVQQSVDKYYLSGTLQQGFLAVSAGMQPVLFCRKGVERARQETPWQVVPIDRPRDLPDLMREAGFPQDGAVGCEADVLPAQMWQQMERLFPERGVVDASLPLRLQRQVKSPFELEEIRAAARVWRGMMEETARQIRQGLDDHLLSVAVDAYGRNLGAQGIMRTRGFNFEYFAPHTLAGPPGAVPAHFDGPTGGLGPHAAIGQGSAHVAIQPGMPVLADFGVGVRGYVADGTRTFFLGELPPQLARAAAVAVDILSQAEETLREGNSLKTLYRQAFEHAEAEGLGEHFMGFARDRVRFLGHGIGLELDELPVLTPNAEGVLQSGMVVAIEPKFVFPGLGAVGVEDSFIIRQGPPELLTDYPRGPVLLGSGR